MELIKLGGIVLVGSVLVASLFRRRDALLLSARRLGLAAIVFWFSSNGRWWRGDAFVSLLIGFSVAVIADTLFFTPRSRVIQEKARLETIRRFEAKTGLLYDPLVHDVDHIVPFARGGGNTVDNLRVIDRKMNRSKGAKVPWWDVLGYLQGEAESIAAALRANISTTKQDPP